MDYVKSLLLEKEQLVLMDRTNRLLQIMSMNENELRSAIASLSLEELKKPEAKFVKNDIFSQMFAAGYDWKYVRLALSASKIHLTAATSDLENHYEIDYPSFIKQSNYYKLGYALNETAVNGLNLTINFGLLKN